MKKLNAGNQKAFTLVELIVVITILSILGTIAFISLEGYSKNSRDGVRIADINSARKSLELYITEKGTYPIPDYASNITYSGGIAWIEGTIGDNVIRNLDKINKKLLDPLTGNEYTYSITASKTEYQIGAISEGGTISQNLPINQTHAATDKKATAMIRGTYNERFLKVQSGTINRILALPSIIATDITQTDVQTILDNSKLVYNNYQNIPHSYNGMGYTMTGGFNYTNTNPLIYTGTLKSLTEDNASKLTFITNLKAAYNGTIIQGEPNYQDIVNINTSNQTGSIYLVNNLINTNVGGIKVSNIILPTSGTTQQEPETPPTYICTGTLVTANATITNTGGLTANTNYQTSNSSNSCYYTCKANFSGTDCETYTAPLVGWRSLDSNCDIEDRVIGTQTWAGCNSTLGIGAEFVRNRAESCFNYLGATGVACNNAQNLSSAKENAWNSTYGINNIWGKMYTWANASSACPTGRHLPTEAEWATLEATLNGSACRTQNDWQCSGLGWQSHTSRTTENNMIEALKIPLAGYYTGEGLARGYHAILWSSTSVDGSTAYNRRFDFNYNTVNRVAWAKTYWVSVRCIKD